MGDANVFNVDDLQGYVFDDLELSGIWRVKYFYMVIFKRKGNLSIQEKWRPKKP